MLQDVPALQLVILLTTCATTIIDKWAGTNRLAYSCKAPSSPLNVVTIVMTSTIEHIHISICISTLFRGGGGKILEAIKINIWKFPFHFEYVVSKNFVILSCSKLAIRSLRTHFVDKSLDFLAYSQQNEKVWYVWQAIHEKIVASCIAF